MQAHRLTAGICGLIAICLPAAPTAAAVKLAVLDVQTTGIEADVGPLLTEVLTAEVGALPELDVVSGRDIYAMIGFEKQKDILGCTDTSCLAEIGGALGVDRILASQVGRLGDTYVVNIKLINIRTTRVEDRVYETVRGAIDEVLSVIRAAVERLEPALSGRTGADGSARTARAKPAPEPKPAPVVERAPEPKPQPPVVEKAPAPKVEPRPERRAPLALETAPAPGRSLGWGAPMLWVLGGAGIGAGVYFRTLAIEHADNANDYAFVGGQLEIDRARTDERLSFIALGAGAAAVVGGFISWLWPDSKPAAVSVAPLATPNALGAVVGAQF